MSKLLNDLNQERTVPYKRREPILALAPDLVYDDGRTKQSHKDETDIVKIMARFEKTGTISHLAKYEAIYADYSDYEYHAELNKLTRGREIFDALPAEVRREFSQSPAAFFEFVNDPANKDDLLKKLPALAEPGQQIPRAALDADAAAAEAAALEPVPEPTPAEDPP